MHRILLSCALLCMALCSSVAQSPDNALLYKLTGPGISKPSYLFGTFHLVCPSDLKLSPATQQAVDSSGQVYLELDMDDPALFANMQKMMMLSDGKTVKDLLKPDDYKVLDNYITQKLHMGLAQMQRMKPIALMSMLYTTLLPCQPASYDMTFAQMATKEKKEILGLESIDAQLAALDKIPVEQQLKGLVEMARKPDEARKEFTDLLAAYNAQDLTKLMNTIHKSQFDGGMAEFEGELLEKRNVSWIPVIEKAAKEKPTFFAFGAGHLGDKTGVLNLLRKKGYTVTPVK